MTYASLITSPAPRKRARQTQPLTVDQVKNNAGGYVYAVSDWDRLNRFLILGSDKPTYYQSARKLTKENADCVTRCWNLDPERTAEEIANVSWEGRAPKNDAAIFALAIGAAHPDDKVRTAALGELQVVCRTATHLFQFIANARALGRGWGRAMKRAVAAWYDSKAVDQVAYQAIKYRQREGYTHKRVLETARPHGKDGERPQLYRFMKGKIGLNDDAVQTLPEKVRAHIVAMRSAELGSEQLETVVELTRKFRLPWEALPTDLNREPKVWQAMLPTMGLTALIRNLGNMTRIGALTPLSTWEGLVCQRLRDGNDIRRARVHPFSVLQAMRVYESGRGFRGSNTWTPSRRIIDALDDAFYLAFQNAPATGKRFVIGLDVSSSMSSPFGGSCVSCAEASGALALVTMATEPACFIGGFAGGNNTGWGSYGGRTLLTRSNVPGFTPLSISPQQRLTDVMNTITNINFGGTDASLPMIYAEKNQIQADAFLVITDNETWAGRVHASQALKDYRRSMDIPDAKLIVLAMTSTGFSIADPNDPGMLDIVGMDSAVPNLIAEFVGKKGLRTAANDNDDEDADEAA